MANKVVKGGNKTAVRAAEDTKARADEKVGSGPKGGKVIKAPAGDDGQDAALAARGMSSEAGAKFWKQTGLKVPTNVNEYHRGKK